MAHVFFSYSHADEAPCNELDKHLAGLRCEGVITTLHDRRIGPGEDLQGQIDDQLDRAEVILLLVSADFITSDYCYDVEMMRDGATRPARSPRHSRNGLRGSHPRIRVSQS